MLIIEKLRLNEFKLVNIPKRRLLYARFAGRSVSDYNRIPTDSDLPDNLIGTPMEDFRAGIQVENYERYQRFLASERDRLSRKDITDESKNDDSDN